MVQFSFVTANGSKVVDVTPLLSLLEGKSLVHFLEQFCTIFSMIPMCLSEACNDGTDHSLLIILGYWLLNLYFKAIAASAAGEEMKCCQEKVFKQR